MPDFDDDEYESFDLEGPGDGTAGADDSEAEFDEPDLDESELADDEDDELEDAAPDEIDFVIAAYREDGQPLVQALQSPLANDLDELIVQLRRLPGDAGALGFVSLVEEVFVIVRVRGQHVQVLLNDSGAANEWPIARDVADLLNEEIPDPDEEETEPMGDLGILSDLGISDFDMETIIDNLDLTSDQMLAEIADKIKIGPQFRKIADAAFPG
jgi:putative tRNA adenosine deaminase-associated protein